MSVGSLGISGGLAGSPLSQKTGAAADRAKQDTAHAQRQTESTQRATDAAGIGQTHEEHEATDRDADGRMLWEHPQETAENPPGNDNNDNPTQNPPTAKDPKGESGNKLDLIG
ncbi:MAG: hypothetical protein WD875_12610 [Pirellulales bacterium]